MGGRTQEGTVLVTGASSGIGLALSVGLRLRGHRVVGSMREVGGRNREAVAALRESEVEVVELDVCDSESVDCGVARAADLLGGNIDIVVNNAGFAMMGPLEAATVDDLRAQFETNVFGPHRIVRACAPAMRERGSGLILQISSGAGRYVQPGGGVYSASKWALEAMSEALRMELSLFGVDCAIIELGPFETQILRRNASWVSDSDRDACYVAIAEAKARDLDRRLTGEALSASAPEEVVEPIAELIATERGQRPTRLALHPFAEELDRYNAMLSELERSVLKTRGYEEFLSSGL